MKQVWKANQRVEREIVKRYEAVFIIAYVYDKHKKSN